MWCLCSSYYLRRLSNILVSSRLFIWHIFSVPCTSAFCDNYYQLKKYKFGGIHMSQKRTALTCICNPCRPPTIFNCDIFKNNNCNLISQLRCARSDSFSKFWKPISVLFQSCPDPLSRAFFFFSGQQHHDPCFFQNTP